jgi:oligosaccharide repeat unit polymerase
MGQIYAFSDFFSFAVDLPSESTYKNDFGAYGAFTFASIFNMFGIGKDFPPGMYEESLGYNDIFETNIFTFFRGLIYDFGVFGSLIFMFIFGIFSNIVMWNILIRRHVFLSIPILISIIVFILMGYIFSVFVARYVFLVACVAWVTLIMDEYIYSGRYAILVDEKKSS